MGSKGDPRKERHPKWCHLHLHDFFIVNHNLKWLICTESEGETIKTKNGCKINVDDLTSNKPTNLVNFLRETMYTEQRFPDTAKFYDNSRGKIGKQTLGNNLEFMQGIKDNWLRQDLDNHKIQRILKKTFFWIFFIDLNLV